MPSLAFEDWNGHKSNQFCSSCQVRRGFCNNFQNKPCLAPHFILSDRSLCIGPHQGIRIAVLHPTFNDVQKITSCTKIFSWLSL
jgi:hypothetical protein